MHLCNEERLRLKAIKEAERAAQPKIPGKKEKPIVIKLTKEEELALLADDRTKMVKKCAYAPKQKGEITGENF